MMQPMVVNGLKLLKPSNNYLFKVDIRNTRNRYELCSQLTIKTPERRQSRCSSIFIVNFEHISQLFLVFLLLILNKQILAGKVIAPLLLIDI